VYLACNGDGRVSAERRAAVVDQDGDRLLTGWLEVLCAFARSPGKFTGCNNERSSNAYRTKTRCRSWRSEVGVFSFAGRMWMIGRPSLSNPFRILPTETLVSITVSRVQQQEVTSFPSHSRLESFHHVQGLDITWRS
jgi:hypothetical protein